MFLSRANTAVLRKLGLTSYSTIHTMLKNEQIVLGGGGGTYSLGDVIFGYLA